MKHNYEIAAVATSLCSFIVSVPGGLVTSKQGLCRDFHATQEPIFPWPSMGAGMWPVTEKWLTERASFWQCCWGWYPKVRKRSMLAWGTCHWRTLFPQKIESSCRFNTFQCGVFKDIFKSYTFYFAWETRDQTLFRCILKISVSVFNNRYQIQTFTSSLTAMAFIQQKQNSRQP